MTKTEGPTPRYMYRIALKVQIPGRPTYDATASSGGFVDPVEMAAIQPGTTVAVRVLQANPEDVRIDFHQPIM
ncbi:hypothetical protein [Mycolicibacterium moriokaense]|nr:hypothetical protein [Mycolicibacterium moriokaense]